MAASARSQDPSSLSSRPDRGPDESGEAAPLGRRERKKVETRARIRRAAARLFAARGFEATTIDEIAEVADIARATFFNYFPEKSAVVADLGDAMTDDFLGELERAQQLDAPVAERLREIFATSAQRLQQWPDLSRALLAENAAHRHDLDARSSQTARLQAGFAGLLANGVERGEVRTDVPIALLAKILSGTYIEILLAWLGDPGYALEANLERAAHVLESALSPTSG